MIDHPSKVRSEPIPDTVHQTDSDEDMIIDSDEAKVESPGGMPNRAVDGFDEDKSSMGSQMEPLDKHFAICSMTQDTSKWHECNTPCVIHTNAMSMCTMHGNGLGWTVHIKTLSKRRRVEIYYSPNGDEIGPFHDVQNHCLKLRQIVTPPSRQKKEECIEFESENSLQQNLKKMKTPKLKALRDSIDVELKSRKDKEQVGQKSKHSQQNTMATSLGDESLDNGNGMNCKKEAVAAAAKTEERGYWPCPACSLSNQVYMIACQLCHTMRDNSNKWVCCGCTFINDVSTGTDKEGCLWCHESRSRYQALALGE